MTFKELIKEFYNDPNECINPCEQFDCNFNCENCFYGKLVIFAEKVLDK